MSGFWKSVTKHRPCKICGKHDWCCEDEDGGVSICRRLSDGADNVKIDKNGAEYYVYNHKKKCYYRPPKSSSSVSKSNYERPPPLLLHDIYSQILKILELNGEDKKSLSARGLSDNEIVLRGYGSLGLIGRKENSEQMLKHFDIHTLLGTPGFYMKNGTYGDYLSYCGSPGILIPVRQHDLIVGLKIRKNEENEGSKYTYFTSSSKNGPSPGALVHVPIYSGQDKSTLRITEGELKADVTTVKSGILTLSIPGVNSWPKAFEFIEEYKPKLLKIAWDSDIKSNPQVGRHFLAFIKELEKHNFKFEVETWN